jgi:hypothetical protein
MTQAGGVFFSFKTPVEEGKCYILSVNFVTDTAATKMDDRKYYQFKLGGLKWQ